MTREELERLRTKFIPTWASLRAIGNSRAVQASVAFPVIGYVILLSSQVTSMFDGGLAGQASHQGDWWSRLWELKLYFVYFGLLNLGIGSALYQLRCPRQIKKHGDWEDYVRIDGQSITDIVMLAKIVGRDFHDDQLMGDKIGLKIEYLRLHYALLSAQSKFSRLAVALCFGTGLVLLSIPSIMSAIKIIALFVRGSQLPI